MKLTGYERTKFNTHVQSMDIMGIRDVLGLNAMDGVV